MFEWFPKKIKINKNKIYISENLLEKIFLKTVNSLNLPLDISKNEVKIEMINKEVEIINFYSKNQLIIFFNVFMFSGLNSFMFV